MFQDKTKKRLFIFGSALVFVSVITAGFYLSTNDSDEIVGSDSVLGISNIMTPSPSITEHVGLFITSTSNPSLLATKTPSRSSTSPSISTSSVPSLFPSSYPSTFPSEKHTVTALPHSFSSEPSIVTSNSPVQTQNQIISSSSQPSPSSSDIPLSENSNAFLSSEEKTTSPSISASSIPSLFPSSYPSAFPSEKQTSSPSISASSIPSLFPSSYPSAFPSEKQTSSASISTSSIPSIFTSSHPSTQKTNQLSSSQSSMNSSEIVFLEHTNAFALSSEEKTPSPSTRYNSKIYQSNIATVVNTNSPTQPQPSIRPTIQISNPPSIFPTYEPSPYPSENPTIFLTTLPSLKPSNSPSTLEPTQSQEPSSPPSTYPTIPPTSSHQPSTSARPSNLPSETISPSLHEQYVPGELYLDENNLFLSKGLEARLLATSGKRVMLNNGKKLDRRFHERPDGAAVFENPNGDGSYVYVSNSEVSSRGGGVGVMKFNADGEVLDYYMVLEGTTRNCSGGKSPWGTWISCEERPRGQIWEVDPWGNYEANITVMGTNGGKYESVAVDNRNPDKPIFYVSNDRIDGEFRRFIPNETIVQNGTYHDVLTSPGQLDYLVLHPENNTYEWTDDLTAGMWSASNHSQNVEGVDFRDGSLYFVSKRQRELFILDTDSDSYTNETTIGGYFDGTPDQLVRLMNEPDSDLIYFTEEDGKHAGIHARDSNGEYYTIMEADETETAGLAFSPDNRRMYFTFYTNGALYEVTRKDGRAFGGDFTTLRHHESMR